MSDDDGRRRATLAALAAVAMMGLSAVGAVLMLRTGPRVGVRTPLILANVAFLVLAVDDVPGAPAGGRRRRVRLLVENRSRSRTFAFRPSYAALLGPDGAPFRPRPGAGSPALEYGSSAKVDLVFDLPAGARGLRLRLGTGGRMGELVELPAGGRPLVALPEPPYAFP